jgi:capsular exopolysaccharide synthesis family protein
VLIDVGVTDPNARQATAIVNGVSAAFVRLVDELERPVTAGAVPPVTVRVVRPASVPQQPSSPQLPVMLALGLLGGLVLGAGAALARHLLDTTVKSAEQLGELAKAPNLTTVGYDGAVRKRPLTVHEPSDAPRAEAFRRLRTNLRFVDVDNHHKVVVVTSPLPADGKTTTTLNLAIALASSGQKVLVVEADLRRPGAAKLLGLASTVGLTSVLSYGVGLEQAIQPWTGGVDLLASGPLPPNPAELLSSRHMAALLAEVRPWYDTVLIDTPPLLPVTDAAAVAPAADGVLLVTRFRRTTRDQVAAAVAAISAVSVPLLGTVFNMVPRRGARAYARYHAYYASRPSGDPAPTPTTPRIAPREAVGAHVRPHLASERTGAHATREQAVVNGTRPDPDQRPSSNGHVQQDAVPDGPRFSNRREPAPVMRPTAGGWSGVEPATPADGTPRWEEPGTSAIGPSSAPPVAGRQSQDRCAVESATPADGTPRWEEPGTSAIGPSSAPPVAARESQDRCAVEPATPAQGWPSGAEPVTPASGTPRWEEPVTLAPGTASGAGVALENGSPRWEEPVRSADGPPSGAEPVTPAHGSSPGAESVAPEYGSPGCEEPVTPAHGTSSSAWFAADRTPPSSAALAPPRAAVALRPSPTPRPRPDQ